MAGFSRFFKISASFVRNKVEDIASRGFYAISTDWLLPSGALLCSVMQLRTQQDTLKQINVHADHLQIIGQNIDKFHQTNVNVKADSVKIGPGVSTNNIDKKVELEPKEKSTGRMQEIASGIANYFTSWFKLHSPAHIDQDVLKSLMMLLKEDDDLLGNTDLDKVPKDLCFIDMKTIQKKVDEQKYSSIEDFKKDILMAYSMSMVFSANWKAACVEEKLMKVLNKFKEKKERPSAEVSDN